MQLLLGRGAGNGGRGSRREPVSHLFTPHVIFTVGQDTHQQICEAFQACMAVLVVISSAHLSHRGHPNAFPLLSEIHPSQTSKLHASDGLCHFQTAGQRRGRCWRRGGHLVAFGHVFQANQKKKKKINHPPSWSLHTPFPGTLRVFLPWYGGPASYLYMKTWGRPSAIPWLTSHYCLWDTTVSPIFQMEKQIRW